MKVPGCSKRSAAWSAAAGTLMLSGGAVLAIASPAAAAHAHGSSLASASAAAPTSSQLKAIGSSRKAAQTTPGFGAGLGSLPPGQPLIAIAFGGRGITVGGSALGGSAVPASAAQCSVNFTQRKVRVNHQNRVSVRWFGGIGCNRRMTLFGQAFLAESAKKFDASGSFYSGQLSTAASGRSASSVAGANPALYIWYATNIFFPERPSHGVLAILPQSGESFNGASSCRAVRSPSYGTGIHCDLYSQRF